MHRSMLLLAFVCFTASVAVAQDPVKVDPQHYKVIFENDQVRVLRIHYGPHERSSMHAHPAGVVVNITDGHLRFTDQNGKVQEVYSRKGEARWFPPFTHMVENLTGESYEGVYIAVK